VNRADGEERRAMTPETNSGCDPGGRDRGWATTLSCKNRIASRQVIITALPVASGYRVWRVVEGLIRAVGADAIAQLFGEYPGFEYTPQGQHQLSFAKHTEYGV